MTPKDVAALREKVKLAEGDLRDPLVGGPAKFWASQYATDVSFVLAAFAAVKTLEARPEHGPGFKLPAPRLSPEELDERHVDGSGLCRNCGGAWDACGGTCLAAKPARFWPPEPE